MESKTEFLCLNCGHIDRGSYCSKCSHSLRVSPENLDVLLAKRLLQRCYYVDLKSSGDHPFPYKELITKLNVLSEKSNQLLAFDGVENYFGFIQIIAIIKASGRSSSDIAKLVDQTCVSLRAEKKRVFPGIKFIRINFWLLFQDGCPAEFFEQIGKNISSKRYGSGVIYCGSFGIDVGQKAPCHTLNRIISFFSTLSHESAEVKAALEQIGECEVDEVSREKPVPTIWRAVREAFRREVLKRFSDFWKTWFGLLKNSSLLAKRISNDKIEVSELLGFFFLSIAIAGIIGRMLGSESYFAVDIYPVVDEFLTCFYWLLVAFMWAPLEHLALKLVKGKGKLRHAYFAKLYTMGITLPITTLIEGVAQKLDVSPDTMRSLHNGGTSVVNLMFAVTFLSICYKVKPNKVFQLFVLIVPLFILVIVLLAVLFAYIFH